MYPETKICIKCSKQKGLRDFSRDSSARDGHRSTCRECGREACQKYARENKEKDRERKRRYRLENPDKIRERNRRWALDNPKKVLERNRRWAESHPENRLYSSAKCRAKQSGIYFSITPEDIVIPELCPILGLRLERGRGKLHDASPSIDRINTKIGYVPGNVMVISHKANRVKSDLTLEEFKKFVAYMESTNSVS